MDSKTAANSDHETIVVVGELTNFSVTDTELERYQAQDLEDIFRTDPSVSVGGSLGVAQTVYVRGIEDTYLNVTVDGAPQSAGLFHHTGRLTLDPYLLKTVEVQAGAGEATSGA
ncbi:Plug domain-containing protein, partial [Vibrio splendidus]